MSAAAQESAACRGVIDWRMPPKALCRLNSIASLLLGRGNLGTLLNRHAGACATSRSTIGRVRWCSPARPVHATYVLAGDGPPLHEAILLNRRENSVPLSELQTPSEAIEFLKAAGFHAFEREWSIGKSIGVAADPSEHGGIQMWGRMVYIAPTDVGWVLHNLRTTADGPTLVGSLEQACQQAIHALQVWAADLPPSASLERTSDR
jgi:hypothetical protein